MAEQNEELDKRLSEESCWTGWRGFLLEKKAALEQPEKEPLPTGWRGFMEKKRREE